MCQLHKSCHINFSISLPITNQNLNLMKKSTLTGLAMLMLASAGTPAMAQSDVYDFSGFTDSGLLELFYKAL